MYVKGTCMEMCPQKERHTREREGLLHRFECMPVPDGMSRSRDPRNAGERGRRSLPKADAKKTVKSFARSAAGLDKTIAEDLRPPEVLIQTVNYLIHDVLTLPNEPFNVIYDFIFDRLRCVRQDVVVQRIMDKSAIYILEVVVRFHLFSGYRLDCEPIDKFDPVINRKHLTDCLRKLMLLYEYNNYRGHSRTEFEILYLISNPDTSDVLLRALDLRQQLKDSLFNSAIHLCFAYQAHNYVKYFRILEKFPPVLSTYFIHQARYIRSQALQAIAQAYGVKSCKLPVRLITNILKYPSVRETLSDLELIKVDVSQDEGEDALYYAKFNKPNSAICLSKVQELSNKIGGVQTEVFDNLKDCAAAAELICPPPC